ncbi:MAG: bifunctional UDP-N-acetylmuramoyl-tripeptide:D-alanyl-D-alanine ligase/alanine racemase [Bacteroidales bacterium]|nr:bifunctional UDP-N-acetylmuramoyl-tripeptide:D-alanyl-D-alanine ligase/alanine racemase [Bacteroidales bacterium]MDD6075882.1 bifunctional UDP-N-acetylmuramoyl-tripeptide:D-alanyl-D-alanine ligase/alanine racemase [Bacteroidales bacterium]MDD6501770.1 bifunctional UDP-N-acetylmuramoyl-tripeptide:D-alanyl-D-alanine ligase/alanine racemase [Bacteroidales bacterium]MDD6537811.1 bifunctional UDP-N-acetylmuramoyl-tripeptide:D-alanyl-D-alanine ligase/alanine racemase [Bacteroidales bacterium]MDD65
MRYTIENVTALIGARRFGHSATQVEWLLTDSRSLVFPETTLFFALRTKVGDGHRYVADLYRRGVRNFVVGTLPAEHETAFPDANFLQVMSPLKALQRLAERHREEHDIPVIGVTGSNGKTVVKEWLYQLLSPTLHVTRSPKSYNSQVGVPLSVCLLGEHSEIGIFEAGISQPGEMAALRAIIQPTIGVMTNIGPAHQENFESVEEKCHEKLSLFQDAKVLVYCADDAVVDECVATSLLRGERLAWSRRNPSAALFVSAVETLERGTRITYRFHGAEATMTIPFTDDASTVNCIHCLAVLLSLNFSAEEIASRMKRLEPVAMRLEVIQGVRNCTLINDTYNSDAASLDIALDFMARRPEIQNKQKVLILSDMFQTGLPATELYAKVAELLNRRAIDHFIGVGPEISHAHSLFLMKKSFFPSGEALADSGLLDTLHDSLVLIKGSRPFGFEKITAALSLRVHETTLHVNLDALAGNLNYYRSFMKPETKMVCMVKASAYGAGSVEVAKTLQDRGVNYLAVAVADEGAELRRAGITAGIIVMNPEMTAFKTLFDYELEPEVYNFKLLDALIKAAEKEGIQGFPVHIKLDTGMHRLGFDPRLDLPALIDRLHHQTSVIPRSVFSHFVGSDSPDFDDFSARQFALFDEASKTLQAAFPHKILRHICNSAGIERFPERHLDMVRLGLGLYGIDPIDNRSLQNVTTLRTTILQIRECPKGDSVGYSRRTVLERDSRIAAIPIGYADGLNRHLGNRRGYCLVNGQRADYVGNICMDVCMIDVTDTDCREGDTVEIFGDNLPPAELARLLDTIPYEILTSVSDRVKRIYFQ